MLLLNFKWRSIGLLFIASVVAACSSDNDGPDDASFDVTMTNLTAAQPMSPVALVVDSEDATLVEVGATASVSLEQIAEGGDNSFLINDVSATAIVATSGVGLIMPGASETISITVPGGSRSDAVLSVVTMLVNTNDALTAVQNVDFSSLAVGESMTVNGSTYDAGTELDTESAGTMPGPADGGEGFNAARDDDNSIILGHPGVITADDGLTTSVLNASHRWDNPASRVTITRTN